MLTMSCLLMRGDGYPNQFGPWIQNVTETSFTVLWTTTEDNLSWVEVSKDDGIEWYQEEHPKFYETVSGRRMMGKFHSITVNGLEPGTRYIYRIFGKTVELNEPYGLSFGVARRWTQNSVRTLDSKADRCRFSLVNDIHADDARFKELMNGVEDAKPDFIVLNGDIVNHSASFDTVIDHTFSPIAKIAANYPVLYVRGNHESRGAEWYKLPKAFPTPTGEFYYSFRHGPVAFLVLDAGEDKPDNDVEYSGTAAFDDYRAQELEWLKQAVKDPSFVSAPHKVCLVHVPLYAEKDTWYSQKWVAEHFGQILNEAGVELVISAHLHRYELRKPGQCGSNAYTVLVNSNNDRLDFDATDDAIHIKTFDRQGKQTHSLDL